MLSGVALLYTVFAPHSSNEKSPLHSCLFVYITQAICACLVEITLVLLFPAHMLLDRNWNVVRAFALVSALLPAMIFIGIPHYRPFDAHYHNVTFEANFGECKHVDIENMDPYIRDICGFHGYSKRHIFTSAAVMEKYDYSDAVLQDFHRMGTAGLAVFGEKMGGSEKIPGLNVSFLDFAFCAVAHVPCSPDCVPQTVCPSAVKPMMRLLNNKYAKEMYYSDCKIIKDYEDTVLLFTENDDLFLDMIDGMRESCKTMLKHVYEGTPLQYASQPCYSAFNFLDAYGLKKSSYVGKVHADELGSTSKRILRNAAGSHCKTIRVGCANNYRCVLLILLADLCCTEKHDRSCKEYKTSITPHYSNSKKYHFGELCMCLYNVHHGRDFFEAQLRQICPASKFAALCLYACYNRGLCRT